MRADQMLRQRLRQHRLADAADGPSLLTGWPQGALAAPAGLGYRISRAGSHTFIVEATEILPRRLPDRRRVERWWLEVHIGQTPPRKPDRGRRGV